MPFGELLILGFVAGVTIFLGLPIGRVARRSEGLVLVLNALTIGVLVFLLWDVLSHAVEPVEAALTASATGRAPWGGFVGLAAVFATALAAGLLGLVAYDRWMEGRPRAVHPDDSTRHADTLLRLHDPASRMALLIAVGIGLHNFSEGLAIGQSAAGGEIQLAAVLVVGFGLHNATEGFGITAPLARGSHRPSWAQLAVLGVIGGGPTVVGTLLGSIFVNDAVSVLFLALAAGSILYVIVQLVGVALKLGRGYRLFVGMLAGALAGFATDFVVTAAGV